MGSRSSPRAKRRLAPDAAGSVAVAVVAVAVVVVAAAAAAATASAVVAGLCETAI